MLTHTEITAQMVAEGDARYLAALAEYQAARAEVVAAALDGNRDRCWRSGDRLRAAERALEVFYDRRQYGPINDRIVAEILAERTSR